MSWLSQAFNNFTGRTAQRELERTIAESNAQATRLFQEQAAEAERQRQALLAAENKRQGNIKAGNSAIDQAFAQFNDDYFKRASDAYSGAQLPDLERQHAKAKDRMTAQLADRGILESSIAAGQFGDMEEAAANARAGIGNSATDFANSLRGNIDASKTKLYDLSASAADPSAVSARAIGESTSLARAGGSPQLQPIGDVFASFTDPLKYFMTAYSNAPGPARPRTSALAPTSGAGSSYVVN